jgi:hypothetical protein
VPPAAVHQIARHVRALLPRVGQLVLRPQSPYLAIRVMAD